jgi:hypothetical protein
MLPKIAQVQIADPDVSRFQQTVVERVNTISGIAFLDGAMLQSVSLKVGDNQIPHKLGRAYNGYEILRMRKAASAIFDNSDDASMTKYLTLNSSVACTVDVWVF